MHTQYQNKILSNIIAVSNYYQYYQIHRNFLILLSFNIKYNKQINQQKKYYIFVLHTVPTKPKKEN